MCDLVTIRPETATEISGKHFYVTGLRLSYIIIEGSVMSRVKILSRVKIVMASPAAANGPIDMIFGMGKNIDDRMPIFGK